MGKDDGEFKLKLTSQFKNIVWLSRATQKSPQKPGGEWEFSYPFTLRNGFFSTHTVYAPKLSGEWRNTVIAIFMTWGKSCLLKTYCQAPLLGWFYPIQHLSNEEFISPNNDETGFVFYGAYNKTDIDKTIQKSSIPGMSIHFSAGLYIFSAVFSDSFWNNNIY